MLTDRRKTPPSSEALRHSGGDKRRCTSATVTLYLDVELSSDSRPGTVQNTSEGAMPEPDTPSPLRRPAACTNITHPCTFTFHTTHAIKYHFKKANERTDINKHHLSPDIRILRASHTPSTEHSLWATWNFVVKYSCDKVFCKNVLMLCLFLLSLIVLVCILWKLLLYVHSIVKIYQILLLCIYTHTLLSGLMPDRFWWTNNVKSDSVCNASFISGLWHRAFEMIQSFCIKVVTILSKIYSCIWLLPATLCILLISFSIIICIHREFLLSYLHRS